ncbi:MAG: LamG-like jellyroll fold domain-containing protein [Victivallaceae bacterium]|jgi:hypothetical protein
MICKFHVMFFSILMLCARLSAAVELVPQPKEFRQHDIMVALTGNVVVAAPAAATAICHNTAVELLKKDFKSQFGIDIKVTSAPTEKTLVITLRTGAKGLPQEGYRMDGKMSGGNYEVVIAADDNGILYGSLTLIDLLKNAGSGKDKLMLPQEFSIIDYPTFKDRTCDKVTKWKDNTQPSSEYMNARLEEMTRMRLNGTWNEWDYLWYRDWAGAAAKYGVRIYSIVGVGSLCKALNHPLCPCKAEDMKLFDDTVFRVCRAGIYGLALAFDDLEWLEFNGKQSSDALSHAKLCPECAARFKTSGNMHNFMLKRAVEIGRACGVKDFMVCPSPYRKDDLYKNDNYQGQIWRGYFAQLTAGPELEAVKTFHCDFDRERLKQLKQDGLHNYIFWINGLWRPERWFTYYTGMPRFYEIWYGFDFDPAGGAVPRKNTVNDLKNLAENTNGVFFGTNETAGLYEGGIWCWNPEKFNEADALKTVSDKIYGAGVYGPMMDFNRSTSGLVVFFQTCFTAETTNTRSDMLPGKSLTLAQAEQELQKAAAACQAVAGIKPGMRELGRMKKTVELFQSKMASRNKQIEQFATEKAIYQKMLERRATDPHICAWWRFNDPAGIGKDSSGNGLDLNIAGVPELVNANFGQAVRLHGGEFKNVEERQEVLKGAREFLELAKDKKLKIGGNDSFSIDLWINYQGDGVTMNNNLFAGSRRSNRYVYKKQKGWSVGSDKSKDEICFTVDDGNNTSTIKAAAWGNSGFDFTGWLHIVAVRDCANKELRLYINGQAIPPVKDETGDISSPDFRIGQDGSAGTWMNAAIDEIRIFDCALTENDLK